MYDFVCICGLVVNLAGFATLSSLWPERARPGLTLMKHQAFLDTSICIVGYILLRAPPMWSTGVVGIDHGVCRVWHSEFLFWSQSTIAGWNLLLLAIEQMMLAWTPVDTPGFKRKIILLHFIASYSIGYALNIPHFTEVALVNGTCARQTSSTGDGFDLFTTVCGFVAPFVPVIYIHMFVGHMCKVRPPCDKKRKKKKSDETVSTGGEDTNVPDAATWIATSIAMMMLFAYGLDGMLHFQNTGRLYKMISDDKFSLVMMWIKSLFTPLLLFATIPMYRHQFRAFIKSPKQASTTSVHSNNV